uniref:Uncharacterized protein n=1 Tax=viral metagenome TaxID=1070528 RepID=A0A6C0J8F1_9ZZZZ
MNRCQNCNYKGVPDLEDPQNHFNFAYKNKQICPKELETIGNTNKLKLVVDLQEKQNMSNQPKKSNIIGKILSSML